MTKIAIAGMLIAAPIILGATTVHASDDVACTSAPQAEWRSLDDVKTAAEALGYKDVRKVEVEDRCYEAYAFDKDGRRVEIYFDPVSLKIVRVKDKS